MTLVSEHFDLSEFACHDGTPYPLEWVIDRLTPLCGVLEDIRAPLGGPLIVVSGYRTDAYQAKIGGVPHSQHPRGTAADVRPLNLASMRRLIEIIRERLAVGQLAALGGWGIYPGWVHVDVRARPADGHVAHWHGDGYGSEP